MVLKENFCNDCSRALWKLEGKNRVKMGAGKEMARRSCYDLRARALIADELTDAEPWEEP